MTTTGQVAAVTGGSSGIGRAIAVKLGSEGIAVAVASRDEAGAGETVRLIEEAGGTAHFTRLDVTRADAVEAWLHETSERFGGLDSLVNNAGMNGPTSRLEDLDVDEFELIIRTNLLSTFYTTRTAIPLMRDRQGGAIVNIGSTASLQGYGLLSAYTASKHAVLGLTKSTALEYADVPIRANCVCPGPVDTPLMRGIEEIVNPGNPSAAREMFEGTTALKRYGTPEEIASLVHFLLSDASAYITGAAISIDGGVTTGV